MKKLIVLVMALTFVMAPLGCGKKKEKKVEKQAPKVEQKAEQATKQIPKETEKSVKKGFHPPHITPAKIPHPSGPSIGRSAPPPKK